MQKLLVGVLVVLSGFFIITSTTNATFGFRLFFGGIIANTEAIEITVLKGAGYDCVIPGSTIEIWSAAGPTSYFIPSSNPPRTNTIPASYQQILGEYGGDTNITCTHPEGSVTNVLLPTISINWGTSLW